MERPGSPAKTAESNQGRAEARSRLEALFEFSPLALGVSRDGLMLDANPAYLKLFGYDKIEELRGTSILRQIAPRHHEEISKRIRMRASGEAPPTTYEVVGLRRDGSEFPFRVTMNRVVTDSGSLSIVAIEDITELRRSEEMRNEAAEIERLLVAASPTGISVYAEDGQCVAANEAMGKIIGAASEEVKTQNFRRIQSWKQTGLLEAAERVLRTGSAESGETHFVSSFGREVWGSWQMSLLKREDQRFLLVQASDTTEKALAERKLRASESAAKEGDLLLQQAVYVSELGIFDHDQRNNTIYLSPRGRIINGWEPDEPATLEKFLDLIHPEDRESISSNVRRAHDPAGDGIFDVEHRIIRRDGSVRWLKQRSQTYFGGEGESRRPVRTVGVIRDITQSKLGELELLKAKCAAEAALKSRTTFLDIAAHELRTPVTTISMIQQFVQKQITRGQTPAWEILARLRAPVERLSHLVVDLLDVSRLERGLLVLRPVPTPMVSLVSECIGEFQTQVPRRRFVFDKTARPIEAVIDPVRINQVLSNLLDNAVKYTPEDSPIEVALECTSKVLRISVIDHGEGIPQEQQNMLFDAFSRGSTEATVRVGGLGLGLSVCRGIIEMHGGRIGVQSEEGRGSTFYFELPVSEISP